MKEWEVWSSFLKGIMHCKVKKLAIFTKYFDILHFMESETKPCWTYLSCSFASCLIKNWLKFLSFFCFAKQQRHRSFWQIERNHTLLSFFPHTERQRFIYLCQPGTTVTAPCFLTVDKMKPTLSSSCLHDFPAMMYCPVQLGAKMRNKLCFLHLKFL